MNIKHHYIINRDRVKSTLSKVYLGVCIGAGLKVVELGVDILCSLL